MVGENMELLIGLISGLVLFVVLLLSIFLGYRLGKKNQSVISNPIAKEDEEEKRKASAIQKHFAELMNYDMSKALQRKRVDR